MLSPSCSARHHSYQQFIVPVIALFSRDWHRFIVSRIRHKIWLDKATTPPSQFHMKGALVAAHLVTVLDVAFDEDAADALTGGGGEPCVGGAHRLQHHIQHGGVPPPLRSLQRTQPTPASQNFAPVRGLSFAMAKGIQRFDQVRQSFHSFFSKPGRDTMTKLHGAGCFHSKGTTSLCTQAHFGLRFKQQSHG